MRLMPVRSTIASAAIPAAMAAPAIQVTSMLLCALIGPFEMHAPPDWI